MPNSKFIYKNQLINSTCDPKDIALKSMFLGPQAENGDWVRDLIGHVFDDWFQWRRSLFPNDGHAISIRDQLLPEFIQRRNNFQSLVNTLTHRFQDEIPKFSPRYIGHMFSEFSLPALFGHLVTLLHNPNNISGESSKIGVQLENEAISFLLRMVGYSEEKSIGHFTSGGTIANFEALFRAKERLLLWLEAGSYSMSYMESAHMGWPCFAQKEKEVPSRGTLFSSGNMFQLAASLQKAFGNPCAGPIILVPAHKHYSWTKGMSLLGLGQDALWTISLDTQGRLSILDLKNKIEQAIREQRPIMMVVSVAGTTELGTIDPVNEVQDLLDYYRNTHGFDIWHHVDAAFGGFFCCINDTSTLNSKSLESLQAIARTDSVTIDPHKMGYVPFSSGTILMRDHRNYFIRSFGAPYIDYRDIRDRGPFTLEGSRSAAGAVATWMTAHTIGLNSEGYGRILARTIQLKRDLESQLCQSGLSIQVAPSGDTNILCFTAAKAKEPISRSNQRTRAIFEKFSQQKDQEFFVSKTSLSWSSYGDYLNIFTKSWSAVIDENKLDLIRMCLMNPFFNSKETRVNYSDLLIKSLQRFTHEGINL